MSAHPHTIFAASQGVGAVITGEAVVSSVPFSARYDLDRTTGVFSRNEHPLRGASIADRILVAPGVQGGVAAGWAFLAMRGLGVGLRALIFGAVNPVMVQGAVTAGLPIVAGLDRSFFDHVRTGDRIRVDPGAHEVEIIG